MDLEATGNDSSFPIIAGCLEVRAGCSGVRAGCLEVSFAGRLKVRAGCPEV